MKLWECTWKDPIKITQSSEDSQDIKSQLMSQGSPSAQCPPYYLYTYPLSDGVYSMISPQMLQGIHRCCRATWPSLSSIKDYDRYRPGECNTSSDPTWEVCTSTLFRLTLEWTCGVKNEEYGLYLLIPTLIFHDNLKICINVFLKRLKAWHDLMSLIKGR